MIGPAVSFITGIAVFYLFPFFPATFVIAGTITTLYLLFKCRMDRAKIIMIMAFAFGIAYGFVRYEPDPGLKIPSGESLIQGTVIDVPEESGGKTRFTIDDVSVEDKEIKSETVNRFFHGRIRLYLPDAGMGHSGLSPGDRVIAYSRLKEPQVLHNPGVHSYDLKKHGISAIGFIKRARVVEAGDGIFAGLHKVRLRIGEIMDDSLSPENASLLKAIIPGLKQGIGREMRQAFGVTGLAHVLSISGTHFGLLAFIIFKILKMLVKLLPERILVRMTLYITPTQIAVIGTLPLLVLYALISGASTPTIRALVMVVIYMTALLLGRKGQWLNSLSIAAILILLWHPASLFELSFILSFMAVLSIGLVFEKKEEDHGFQNLLPPEKQKPEHKPMFARALERLKTTVLITIAAVLGTAPFVALYFKQIPLISPVTNLIVTPVICFAILPLGFFSVIFSLLFNMPVMPFNAVIDSLVHFALLLVKAFSEVPFAGINVHNPSIIIVVLYFTALLFIVKSRARWRFLPFIFIIVVYLVTPYISSDGLRVTFLDVGQGESSVVELPDEKVILIDGGTSGPDAGRMVVAPYLWSRGIRRIDYLVLSHAHPDHYGGLLYVMDNFDIGEVWIGGGFVPEAEGFFQKIKNHGIFQRTLKRGDMLEAEGYKVLVLHPYDGFFAGSSRGEFSDENSGSLVLKIETEDVSLLFTGDVEEEAEQNIVYLDGWLKSNVLKVPHHGGRTSSTSVFIRTVGPDTAVVSAGKNNPFNHPHKETVKRYEALGVRMYRTYEHGAVIVSAGQGSYNVTTYGEHSFSRVNSWKDELKNLSLLVH